METTQQVKDQLSKLYGTFFSNVDMKMAIERVEVGRNIPYAKKIQMINDLTQIIDELRKEIRTLEKNLWFEVDL